MTDSLTTKVASSPTLSDPEIPHIQSTTPETPGNESPRADIIEKTEVIRRVPSKAKNVIRVEDHDDEDDTDLEGDARSLRSTLEDELYEARLLNLPGLIEHLFPDELLPIPFDSLKLVAMSRLWDHSKEQWKDHDPASSTFFNYLSKALVDAALTHPYYDLVADRLWSSECHMPPYGTTDKLKNKRTYGLNLVDKKRSSTATWSTVVVNVERRTKAREARSVLEHLTEGAAMIFHHQPERRFVISLSICGNEFRVYVFDRAGLVGSEPFHLKKDSDSLIRLMAGLVLTDNSCLGFDPSISVQVDRTGRISRTAMAGGQIYQLVKTLSVSHDLTGRGSVIWHARRGKVDYVIKDTWVDASSTRNEADLLQEVKGVEGITQIISNETMTVSGARIDDTSHLRRFLDGLDNFRYKECYESLPVRVHNRIVTTPFASPLKTFKSKRELVQVLIDAIEAHRRLVEKNIMHCDISCANILIHRESVEQDVNPFADPLESSKVSSPQKKASPPRAKGILIDLDNAVITHDKDGNPTEEALSMARFTGTLPYASVEALMGLLPGKIREAHHDLESFFYVLLWFSLRYAGPNGLRRTDIDVEMEGQMRLWVEGGNRGDPREIGEAKYTTMTTTHAHFRRVVTGKCTPYFKDLVPCIEELWLKFFPKETRPSEGTDCPEDVRPKVTHQEVIDILRKPLEWLPEVDEAQPDSKVVENENKATAAAALTPESRVPVAKRKKPDHEEDEGNSEDSDEERPSAKRARVAPKIIVR